MSNKEIDMELTAPQRLQLHTMWVGSCCTGRELPEFDSFDEIEDYEHEFDLIGIGSDEVREGEVETGIECKQSSKYSSRSVAVEIDGTWIGWTYWYGGGKHGKAYSVEWIKEAYYLEYTEEKKIVRSFTKKV